MKEGWKTAQLGDVCLINPDRISRGNSDDKIRYIDISSVGTGYLNAAPQIMALANAPSRAQRLVRTGDVILSTVRPNRRSILKISKDLDGCVASTGFATLRARPNQLDAGFLWAIVAQQSFTDYLVTREEGAAYPAVSGNAILEFTFDLPPLPEQRAIASVLGAPDDKIALNRRMNATLEAMAQALFRDWFVDFGPTRAKEAKEPPTLAPDLWSLFSARLDENGIPEGWEMRRVDQLMELAYGKALRAADRKPGPVPVYGSGGINGEHSEALVEGPSVIIGRKGTVGSLYWEDRPFFPIDTVFYVRPLVPLTFCYYALNTLGLDKMNTDAAVPGLNRNNAYRLEIAWLGERVVEEFDRIAHAIRERIRHNAEESRTLARTRDLLLPRRMSREVRMKPEGHGGWQDNEQ